MKIVNPVAVEVVEVAEVDADADAKTTRQMMRIPILRRPQKQSPKSKRKVNRNLSEKNPTSRRRKVRPPIGVVGGEPPVRKKTSRLKTWLRSLKQ
jgi:hypothetical protein